MSHWKLWKSVEIICPEINELSKKYSLVRADYFGKTWEGNETNKLLKHTTELKKIIPEYLHIFVDCMDSLNDVKKACFGFTLDQNYKEKKEELDNLWNILHENFGVTIPNKCHVIFSHVREFIKRQKTIRRIFRTSCRECTPEVGSDLAMVYCKRFRKRTSWDKFS